MWNCCERNVRLHVCFFYIKIYLHCQLIDITIKITFIHCQIYTTKNVYFIWIVYAKLLLLWLWDCSISLIKYIKLWSCFLFILILHGVPVPNGSKVQHVHRLFVIFRWFYSTVRYLFLKCIAKRWWILLNS